MKNLTGKRLKSRREKIGKSDFSQGKKSGKVTLPPKKNFPVMPCHGICVKAPGSNMHVQNCCEYSGNEIKIDNKRFRL